MVQPDSLSTVLNKLKQKGYTEDFNLQLNLINTHIEDFVIDESFRFEGMTDPGDESILLAISSEKHHLKGVLVNGYGISNDQNTDATIKKLHR